MRNIGYINKAQLVEQMNVILPKMSNMGCSVILCQEGDDAEHQEWKRFVSMLHEGDVAVLYSFDNAFKNFNDMIFFLKMCSNKHVRIISIEDSVDSSDKLFPASGTQHTLEAIANMSATDKTDTNDDFEAELISDKHLEKKQKRHRMVINMYNAGYNIKEIMSRTGYKGKSNIYRILHKYDIELAYPTMVRSKQNPHLVIRNI